VLLLSVAGLNVPEAHRVARQHVVDIGLGRGNRWGRPLTDREQADASRDAVDRMLAHVIWPSDSVRFSGLGRFSVRRPLPAWTAPKVGVFQSPKLGRLVQFESELELVILRQLDSDSRVVECQEQPVTIPYVIDGEAREYTPDVMVRLDDGRAFIVEAKPEVGLGDFTNWMKWASLARWCEQAGIGFWIGGPQRSITEHRCTRQTQNCANSSSTRSRLARSQPVTTQPSGVWSQTNSSGSSRQRSFSTGALICGACATRKVPTGPKHNSSGR
jgi:hypothetical protein